MKSSKAWIRVLPAIVMAAFLLALPAAHILAADAPATAKPHPAAEPAASPAIGEGDLLPYLEQAIAWQRESAAIEATPGSARESLLKDALGQSSSRVLTYSFQFARTQAEIIDKQTPSSSPLDQDGDRAHLQASDDKVKQRIDMLQDRLDDLQDQLEKSPAKQRAALKAQQQDLQGQLRFATAQLDLMNNVLGVFNGIVNSSNTGLLGKVNSLAESSGVVSDKAQAVTAAAPKPAPASASAKAAADTPSQGLLDLGGDLFKLWREIRDVEALSNAASDLRKTNKQFLDSLRAGLRDAIKQGTALGTSAAAGTPAVSAPGQGTPETLDEVLANFKQLATGVVPVTQTNVWLDASIRTLDEWEKTIQGELTTVARRLSIRLAVLAVLILIPVAVAEVARRATNRYVRDDKRQKQLRAVRRTLLTITIVIIVLLNLVSEIGSIATFAGVITAGLAVAFQNVLLSLVAHFFFYGRYSVRAGDRVSVSGVIGDVVHVGAVRFYMRELEDKDGKLESTGRVAAFPNSILFQTSAFFKYV